MLASLLLKRTTSGTVFTLLVVLTLAGCSSSADPTTSEPGQGTSKPVSITAFAKTEPERTYLDALTTGVRFEQRDGCLYVGDDQAVWFFGTTVRPKPNSTQYEVLDFEGRKIAETGTAVNWGGGQVTAAEAEANSFADKLNVSAECKQRNDSYWIVGKMQSPLFETDN